MTLGTCILCNQPLTPTSVVGRLTHIVCPVAVAEDAGWRHVEEEKN